MHKQQVVAIEFSSRREHVPSASKTFATLIVLDYIKKATLTQIEPITSKPTTTVRQQQGINK